jgi:hypothetical protein
VIGPHIRPDSRPVLDPAGRDPARAPANLRLGHLLHSRCVAMAAPAGREPVGDEGRLPWLGLLPHVQTRAPSNCQRCDALSHQALEPRAERQLRPHHTRARQLSERFCWPCESGLRHHSTSGSEGLGTYLARSRIGRRSVAHYGVLEPHPLGCADRVAVSTNPPASRRGTSSGPTTVVLDHTGFADEGWLQSVARGERGRRTVVVRVSELRDMPWVRLSALACVPGSLVANRHYVVGCSRHSPCRARAAPSFNRPSRRPAVDLSSHPDRWRFVAHIPPRRRRQVDEREAA